SRAGQWFDQNGSHAPNYLESQPHRLTSQRNNVRATLIRSPLVMGNKTVKFWLSTTISPGKRPSLSHPIQGHKRPTATKIIPTRINVRGTLASLKPKKDFSHIDIPQHNTQGSAPPDSLPWTAPTFAAVKGTINAPCIEPE